MAGTHRTYDTNYTILHVPGWRDGGNEWNKNWKILATTIIVSLRIGFFAGNNSLLIIFLLLNPGMYWYYELQT